MNRQVSFSIAFFIWVYCLAAVLDPSDSIIGVKRLLFAVVLAFFLAGLLLGKVSLSRTLLGRTLAVAFALPAFWLAVLMWRQPGTSAVEGVTLAYSLLPVLLVLPVVASGTDLRKPLFTSLFLMAAFAVALAIGSFADPIPQRAISEYLVAKNAALVGTRVFGEVCIMMIFFTASPLLVLPVPYLVFALYKRKGAPVKAGAAALLGLLLGAAFLSASRALFLILLLEIAVFAVILIRSRGKKVVLALSMALVCALAATFLTRKTALFSTSERSNSVKIGHMTSFVSYIAENPSVLLTGDGLGARYYSDAPGVESMVFQTELTYLDMVRYFGLAGTLLLVLLLAWPRGFGDMRPIVGFCAYLLLAGSNPLIFNSTGMLAVCFYWAAQEASLGKTGLRGDAPGNPSVSGEVSVALQP